MRRSHSRSTSSQTLGNLSPPRLTIPCLTRSTLAVALRSGADGNARSLVVDSRNVGAPGFRQTAATFDAMLATIAQLVRQVATGLLGTEIHEEIIGTAQVRDVFRSSKFGAIAGCMVIEGSVKRHKPIRVLRDNVVIFQGELESLRRFKENVDEVRNGMECGIAVKQYNDVKPGDQIECFERHEVARTF